MKNKDTASEPEVKKRRKGTRTSDPGIQSASEIHSSPPSSVLRSSKVDGTHQFHMKRTARHGTAKDDASKVHGLMDISFMDLEANESMKYESIEGVNIYRKTCQEIEKLVTEIDHLKAEREKVDSKAIAERRIKSTLLTLSLKRLSRFALIKSKTAREKTQEMKQKVDFLHLNLQNMLYEVMHMKKGIQKCTEFTSKDEEIDLVDIDTFYEEAPPEISQPEVTKDNKHSQMLSRLEWELDQRKKLAAMKNQLVKHKSYMEKDISNQTEILMSLQPSLAGILKATMPLQEKLGLRIDEKKIQYETAAFLPKPLYVLYVQANAHCEGGDDEMSVVIEGDAQAAKALIEADAHKSDEYEDSEPEDGNEVGDKEENKRRRHNEDKEKARLEEQRRSTLKKHPLQVQVNVNCEGSIVINMTFSYLTSLNIVTVSTAIQPLKESSCPVQTTGSLLSPHTILHNLLGEKDDGEDSPNVSNQIALKKLGLEGFPAYVAELGRPYCWVQGLSGLSFLPKDPQQSIVSDNSRRSQNFASVITAIRRRISTRLLLQKQLIELETLSVPASGCATSLFPPNPDTRIVGWKAITCSDFKECSLAEDLLQSVDENDLFYSLHLRRGKEELVVFVSIGVNYPWQPPLFIVQQNQSMLLNNFAREIECELNINFTKLIEHGKPDMLLTNQVWKLMTCFDVYCETGDSSFKQERFYIRKQRGRDRSRPYNYFQEKGLFIH